MTCIPSLLLNQTKLSINQSHGLEQDSTPWVALRVNTMMNTLMPDEVHDLDTSRAATTMTEVDDLDVALLMPMNSEVGR